jgi:hypothetical protein
MRLLSCFFNSGDLAMKRFHFGVLVFICAAMLVSGAWGQAPKQKGKPAPKGKAAATKTAETKTFTFEYDARYTREDTKEDVEERAAIIQLSGIPNISSFVGVLDFNEPVKDKKERLEALVKVQSNGLKGVKFDPIQEVKFKHSAGLAQTFSWEEEDLGKSTVTYYLLEHQGAVFGVRHMTFGEEDGKAAKPIIDGILQSIRSVK